MEDEIFSLVAAKIKEAGTADPVEVAQHFDIMVVDLKGSIIGYAALYNGIVPAIGINIALKGKWYRLVGWHELAHVFDRHIYESGFKNGHADFSSFGQDIDSRTLSRHEKIANLVAADVCIPDDDVIEIIGYKNPTMQSYRRLKLYQNKLLNEFENLRYSTSSPTNYMKAQLWELRRKITGVGSSLSDMESELVSMNCCRTFTEMSVELDVNESILRYKLEAMNLKGYDIDRQELERYDRVFDGII